jgi:flagellar basal-body rod protein FlgF
MNRGLYTAASGMLSGLRRYETVVQNLSNAQTIGYKADRTTLTDFPSLLLYRLDGEQHTQEVGETATGVSLAATSTDFSDGSIRLTDQPFDFAIVGDGYFRVETPEGERYTRDGRFHRDLDGRLVTADGDLVLGTNGVIMVPTSNQPFTVTPQGAIFVEDNQVAQISLASFEDPADMQKVSQTVFASMGAEPELVAPASVKMYQGYLEESNVDVSREVTEMMSIMRAFEASQRLVQYQDQINSRTVTELGRV